MPALKLLTLLACGLALGLGCGDADSSGGGSAGDILAACKAACVATDACYPDRSQAECEAQCDQVVEFTTALGAPAACLDAGAQLYRCVADLDDCDAVRAVEAEAEGHACSAASTAQTEACSG